MMRRLWQAVSAQASEAATVDGEAAIEKRGPAATSRTISAPGKWTVAAFVIAALALIPLATVMLALPGGGIGALARLAQARLGDYVMNTGALVLLSGAGAAVIGTGTAWLVSASDFPGRKVFAWALVLPLAVPAYIAAYLYADLLDPIGLPIRSLAGASLIFALVLYPYVYLLARTAFAQQSRREFHAARSLGAGPWRAFRRVALPGARPAIAGGTALVGMEVLADFGIADYFAIPTFSTGIFRSWLLVGDREGALGLAALMLAFVAILVAIEASTRRGVGADGGRRNTGEALVRLGPPGKALAFAACALPLMLGFLVPAIHLARLAADPIAIAASRNLGDHAGASAWLGLSVALVCMTIALVLSFARRRSANAFTGPTIRLATLGYALPGALLAVGLLAPLGWIDQRLSLFARDAFGYSGGLILSGTGLILIYALSVRFLTVGYNALDGGMAQISPSLDGAARSLGAGPSRVFARIYLPLLRPSLVAGLALVLIDTIRELPATLILRPFDFETLATRTYRLASDERLVEASIPALILLAAGLIPVLLLTRTPSR